MATTLTRLNQDNVLMVRLMGKQIALFQTSSGVWACDNRCPHEGYPLSEGSLAEDCTLTCNWHNWKFNLQTGENLFGGDKLRTYPVEIRNNEIWLDISELPYQHRYKAIVDNLHYAFDHDNYDQIARECARLIKLGADPMDPVRHAIQWSWQRLEFGWTHAYAGMADWLQLYDEYPDDPEIQLSCILECISHTAFDVLRETDFPYGNQTQSFDEDGFVDAIEQENQPLAIAMIAGGIKNGLKFVDFESALSHSALAHYNDFGHSLIYVSKAGLLIDRLGDTVTKPLLFSLVRSLIYAPREDRIPEFRDYQSSLDNWGQGDISQPDANSWHRQGIRSALGATVACSNAGPEKIFRPLLLANAIAMLEFNIEQQNKIQVTVSGNVGWLDFSHGLTFANAVHKQCSQFPELWPRGLLQMACFVGRNSAYTIQSGDHDSWRVEDMEETLQGFIEGLFSHGQRETIVSVHLLKTTLAVREEIRELDTSDADILVAALNRFLNSPLKLRLPRRTAHQSLQFVAKEK